MIFIQWPEDCLRIQVVLLKSFIFATIPECQEAWERRSGSVAAGWLGLPASDDDLYKDIEPFLGPIEGWNA